MKKHILLFLIIHITLFSCNGQNPPQPIGRSEDAGIIDLTKADTVKELGNNIMLVYQDKEDNYWFGSWEDGLYRYDGKTILHFTIQNGLPQNRIDEIKEDNSGNIYFAFAASSTIIKFDGEKFTKLKEAGFGSTWKLEKGDLWFKDGWDSKSVFRYDGKYLHKLPLPATELGEEYISKNPTHPNPYSVYSIYSDSRGNVWFGTGALGAFRYNGKSFDWILEKDVVEIFNLPSEGSNGVRSIIEDKDGYFWFNSMYRYKVHEGKELSKTHSGSLFYSREESVGSLEGKSDGSLTEYLSIAKDSNNHLWIATYTSGVYHYNGKDLTHFVIKNGSKEIKLFSIYKDKKGILWLGTPETGAYTFNGQTFERFKP